MQNAELKYKGNNLWIKPSLPMNVRVPKSFLLGLKYLLGQWGYDRKKIQVDDEDLVLRIDKQEVCTAYAMDGKLHVIWDKVWETWREMHSDDDFVKLLKDTNAKLGKMGGSKGHGKSKVSSNVLMAKNETRR